jgi:hypothetical protein
MIVTQGYGNGMLVTQGYGGWAGPFKIFITKLFVIPFRKALFKT